jgi:hypothetical protein
MWADFNTLHQSGGETKCVDHLLGDFTPSLSARDIFGHRHRTVLSARIPHEQISEGRELGLTNPVPFAIETEKAGLTHPRALAPLSLRDAFMLFRRLPQRQPNQSPNAIEKMP